jgi:membrane protease YdiL (CAAX protease family)
MKRYHKTFLFIAITFGLSWLLIAAFRKSGGIWNSRASMFVATLYMFVPLASVYITQKFFFKAEIKKIIGFKFTWNRWFVAAWILPFIIAAIALGISILMPGASFTLGMEGIIERYSKLITPEQLSALKQQMASLPVHPAAISLLQAFVAGITINALFAFGEEAGWRGFLLGELRHLGFWNSSLVIGIIWGIWHAPLILMGHNYPDHPQSGVFMMIVFCMLFSPLLTLVREKSDSVLAAAILHGTFNATAGLHLC